MGNSVQTLFEDLNLKADNPVFYDFDHITEFWFESIRRINPSNSNILPESVLLYTLSYLSDVSDNVYAKADSEFNVIVEYVNTHFTDPEISLKQIAGIFSYTQKYLSFLFKKMMNVGFNEYVNHLRIQHSLQLIDQKMTSITQISELCGFSDPLYFSKVFKKKIEVSPANYIRQKNNN
jgi:YesN/AraC family two-component response regulator